MFRRKKKMDSIVDTVIEELQKRGGDGRSLAGDAADSASKAAGQAMKSAGHAYKSASGAVKDAKVEKILDFIEENTTVLAQVGKKLAGDAVKEAPAAAAAVGDAVSNVAEAGAEAVSDAFETFGKEVFRPTFRYGRGVRHGLFVGVAIAMLYTPWPGKVLREKLTAFGREAMDLVEAMRAGAADSA